MTEFICRRHAVPLVRTADPNRRYACPVGERPENPALPQECAISWIPA